MERASLSLLKETMKQVQKAGDLTRSKGEKPDMATAGAPLLCLRRPILRRVSDRRPCHPVTPNALGLVSLPYPPTPAGAQWFRGPSTLLAAGFGHLVPTTYSFCSLPLSCVPFSLPVITSLKNPFFFFEIFFSSELYIQHGAPTHNPEMKNYMRY